MRIKNPHFCLDLVFIYGLLNKGYDIEEARELRVAKKLGGYEMGWSLGASMVSVEQELDHHESLVCKE